MHCALLWNPDANSGHKRRHSETLLEHYGMSTIARARTIPGQPQGGISAPTHHPQLVQARVPQARGRDASSSWWRLNAWAANADTSLPRREHVSSWATRTAADKASIPVWSFICSHSCCHENGLCLFPHASAFTGLCCFRNELL